MPTEKKEEFSIAKVTELLKAKFPNLTFELMDIGQLVVWCDKRILCEMWMDEDCYLLDEVEGEEDDNEWYDKFKALNLKKDITIGFSYGSGMGINESTRSQILTFLCKYFKGYWLDEGIHPEFISHDDEFLNKYV